jgi:hypothetical protein
MSENVLVISLTITEYDDGKTVNEAKLRQEGTGDYLATAQRVIAALAGPQPSEETE